MTEARVIVRGVRKVEGLAPRPPLPRAPRQHVGPRPGDPYWQERGWTPRGTGLFTGWYRAGQARFEGRIDAKDRVFLIHRPPEALSRHRHWACFRYREDGWYAVHFATRPQDMSSGIMEIERILCEALGATAPSPAQRIVAQTPPAVVNRLRARTEVHDATRPSGPLTLGTNVQHVAQRLIAQAAQAVVNRQRSQILAHRSRTRKETHDDTRRAGEVTWRWIYIVILIVLALFSFLV